MDIELIKKRLQYFYNNHKRLPTHGEMVKLLHYSSKGSTYYVVKRLIQEGIVEKDSTGKLIPKNLFSIPMYGIIKAGSPTPVEVQEDRNLNLHVLFRQVTKNSFALTVSGDSMIDEGIHDGDLVFVTKDMEVRNGDIVAALVDGEWTVKYFQKQDGKISLIPANRNYKPIIPKQSLEIGGVVIHVIRSYR